jgi:hypothetical protein
MILSGNLKQYHFKKSCSLILAISLFFFNAAYSQLTKGIWLAGGTGTFYSYNDTYKSEPSNTEFKNTEVELAASAGYFVADKFALGLRPTFSLEKTEPISPGGGHGNTKRYTIGPFARYYLLNADKPFNIVSDISYQFGWVNHLKSSKGHINNFSIMAGPVIFFNTSVGVAVLLGYRASKEEIKDSYKDSNNGFQTSIGFQIHLEKE